MLPPLLVRRLLLAPVVLILAGAAILLVPLWILVVALLSRYLPGRWRPLRIAWFVFVYLLVESITLVVLFGVWVASIFGWLFERPGFQRLHYWMMGWYLRRVMGSARRTLGISVDSQVSVEDLQLRDRPLIVLSRHAGPGDSVLLADSAINSLRRRPRIVLKDLLQLDPAVDTVLNRVPTQWVPHATDRRGDVAEGIAELASTMGPDDCVLLFPEGANFTERRRHRLIEKAQRLDLPELGERARSLTRVLPPRAKGTLSALAACPDADVLLIAHRGLEQLSSVLDLWRGLPLDSAVVANAWLVHAEDIPPPDQRDRWLYEWWVTINDWIDDGLAGDVEVPGETFV